MLDVDNLFTISCSGCPQGIARKGRYGAFLMEHHPSTACDILSALRQSLPASVTVSAKIRLPLDSNKLPERISRLLDTGIDFLTIHGRTLRENKVAVGACHLDELARAVDLAREHTPAFPIVANGGIESLSDVQEVKRRTKATAVMSSEALLENPGLFSVDSSTWSPRRKLDKQFRYASEYLELCRRYPPLPGVLGHSCNMVRSHLFKILFRYLSEQEDLRDDMASHRTCRLVDFERVCLELFRRYDGILDDELESFASSRASGSWYRRHWSLKRDVPTEPITMTNADRKTATQLRIAKLRAQRNERRLANQSL